MAKPNWTFKVDRVPDEDPDLSWLGEFSDTPGEGAIDHHETDTWLGRSYQGPRYFNPGNYDPEYPENAQADYKRLTEYHQGYWHMLGVVLTVYLEGTELASASVWGIESDSGEEYFDEVAEDLKAEALSEAETRIKGLVAAYAEGGD